MLNLESRRRCICRVVFHTRQSFCLSCILRFRICCPHFYGCCTHYCNRLHPFLLFHTMCRGVQARGTLFFPEAADSFTWHRWQWRAFLVGGGSAAWIFLYGIYYWATQLRLDSFSSTVVYFGYLSLLSLLAFLCTASVGFLASCVPLCAASRRIN